METSKKYGFYLPSRDTDDIVDINQISNNFRIIDDEMSSVSLDEDSIVVFLGGNAEGSASVELVIDDRLSQVSENPVKNKVVTQAIRDLEANSEITSNKTNEINKNSTEQQYPSAKAVIDYIENTVDFIVERGEEGIWTFEKWNSGKAICKGEKYCGEVSIEKQWYSLYESNTFYEKYPIDLFKENPHCYVELISNGGVMKEVMGRGTKENTPEIYFVRPSATSVTEASIYFFAIGKWK